MANSTPNAKYPPWNPAFFVGVTGYMDLADGDMDRLAEHVRLLFRFLRYGTFASPTHGYFYSDLLQAVGQSEESKKFREVFRQWSGLPKTRIVILSSLAPGADTLVADIAREPEFKEDGFFVRAPLPFPEDIYKTLSTFRPNDPGYIERTNKFDEILNETQRVFPVLIKDDARLSASALHQRFQDDATRPNRRHDRYRASGEYIAMHSHLLLAMWDGREGQPSGCGAAEIVGVRCNQLRPRFIPVTGLRFPHGSPVLQFTTVKPGANAPAITQPRLCFRYPDEPKSNKLEWHQQQLSVFRENCDSLAGFNNLDPVKDHRLEEACRNFFLYPVKPRKLHEASESEESVELDSFRTTMLKQHCDFHDQLNILLNVRRRASDSVRLFQKRYHRTLSSLFWTTFVGGFLLHMFAHWHPQSHPPGEHHGFGIRHVIGILALISGVVGMIWYCVRRSQRTAEIYHDLRAVAEGMRVQVAWSLAGVGESVPANYMQRQRAELDWIRGAIRAIAAPYELWTEHFRKLDPREKITAISCVLHEWIHGQCTYFAKNVKESHERLHTWHNAGGLFAWTGLLMFAAAWINSIFVESDCYMDWRYDWAWTILIGILVIAFAYLYALMDEEHHAEPIRKPSWNWRNLVRMAVHMRETHGPGQFTPGARRLRMFRNFTDFLPESSVLATLTITVSVLLNGSDSLPDAENWVIILGGTWLLAGGMSVAWAEKNLFSEFAYQYSTMFGLFRNARLRVIQLLEELEASLAAGNTQEFDELINTTQHFILDLGKEALDENAEWLILHRARPLEPLMPA